MIKKLQESASAELFKKIYGASPQRTLLIDDGTSSRWQETDVFPKVGEDELLISDVQTSDNLKSFITVLHSHYVNMQDETFFFLQEEYISGSEPVRLECDLDSLDEIVKFIDEAPNLNAILFDSPCSWLLKFHHELFGYFSGDRELCTQLRNSELEEQITNPVWL